MYCTTVLHSDEPCDGAELLLVPHRDLLQMGPNGGRKKDLHHHAVEKQLSVQGLNL